MSALHRLAEPDVLVVVALILALVAALQVLIMVLIMVRITYAESALRKLTKAGERVTSEELTKGRKTEK